MRIMAVDLGDARTGIAVSDAGGSIAGEAFTINDRRHSVVAEIIAREAKDRGVQQIVLGLPKNMDGSLGERAEKSREFSELLQSVSGLEVILWDERRTTVDAHRILADNGRRGKQRKKNVDAVAATLILEGYLNSLH